MPWILRFIWQQRSTRYVTCSAQANSSAGGTDRWLNEVPTNKERFRIAQECDHQWWPYPSKWDCQVTGRYMCKLTIIVSLQYKTCKLAFACMYASIQALNWPVQSFTQTYRTLHICGSKTFQTRAVLKILRKIWGHSSSNETTPWKVYICAYSLLSNCEVSLAPQWLLQPRT